MGRRVPPPPQEPKVPPDDIVRDGVVIVHSKKRSRSFFGIAIESAFLNIITSKDLYTDLYYDYLVSQPYRMLFQLHHITRLKIMGS